jgi:hypothetical protein
VQVQEGGHGLAHVARRSWYVSFFLNHVPFHS